jgi:hypothetical protein
VTLLWRGDTLQESSDDGTGMERVLQVSEERYDIRLRFVRWGVLTGWPVSPICWDQRSTFIRQDKQQVKPALPVALT